MTITLDLSPVQEAIFKARAHAMGLTIEQWLLQLAEEAREIDAAPERENTERRPIWEIMLDNVKDIPREHFAQLPHDSASEVDHYLYGHPKRNQ